MANEVVPFGKYKGQPLEVLLGDAQYMSWLSEQPWVAERYPIVQTLIINNYGEPDETPEHNAFQGNFYDGKYLFRFFDHLMRLRGYCFKKRADALEKALEDVNHMIKEGYEYFYDKKWQSVARGHNCLMDGDLKRRLGSLFCYDVSLENCAQRLNEEISETKEALKICDTKDADGCAKIVSEVDGWDVRIYIQKYFHLASPYFPFIYIELKPEIGDDFPAILRQVKNNRDRVLKKCVDHDMDECAFMVVYKAYTGCGVSESVMRKQFEGSDFQIVKEDEFINECGVAE